MRDETETISVFISYSHEDENLRQKLEEHLSALRRGGRLQTWHDREVQPGENLQDQIDAQLKSADLVLLLVSSAYLHSDQCWNVEMRRALKRHEAGETQVLLVLLRPCDWWNARFDGLGVLPSDDTPVTLWSDQDQAFLDVVQGIRKTIENRPIRRPIDSKQPNLLRAPYGLPRLPGHCFVGRGGELEDLHRRLVPRSANALTPVVAAHGVGGVGKSRLAIEYAWRYLDAYPGGVFFAVAGERSPLEIWAELAGQLFSRHFSALPDAAEAILTHFNSATGQRRLVILDNVAGDGARFTRRFEIHGRPFNPVPTSAWLSVLMTTRLANVPGVEPFPVLRLAGEDALSLLLERADRPSATLGPEEKNAATELADGDLGGHALGLSLAGAYLRKVPSVDLITYQANLRQRGLTAALEEAGRRAGHTVTDHDRSIVATFRLSHTLLDSSELGNALARRLLDLVAFLAPSAAIDRGLLRRLLRRAGHQVEWEELDLAVARLLEVSLLDDAGRTDVRIHALVADYVRWNQETASRKQHHRAVVAAVKELFPEKWSELWQVLMQGGRAGWEPLTPAREAHAIVLLKSEESSDLLNGARLGLSLGHVRRERGNLYGALDAYMRAKEICHRRINTAPPAASPDPELAYSYRWIGNIFKMKGDLSSAFEYYQKNFEIANCLSPENIGSWRELAVSQNNIGDVSLAQGDLAGALERYRASFEIARRLSSKDPENADWQRNRAVSLERIGDVLKEQGDLAGALKQYQVSLEIVEHLTLQDPDNASWQHDLAILHLKKGDLLHDENDLSGAQKLYLESLRITQLLISQDRDNASWQRTLAVSYLKAGDILQGQGDLAGAQKHYLRSLEIRLLWSQDSDNADWMHDRSISRERIGDVLWKQGDLTGALEQYRASFKTRERLCLRDPYNTAWLHDLSISRLRIGDVLKEQGKVAEALRNYRASLEVARRLLSQDLGNVRWQIDVAVSSWCVAKSLDTSTPAGQAEAATLLAQALIKIQRIDEAGTLAPSWQDWIQSLKAALCQIWK